MKISAFTRVLAIASLAAVALPAAAITSTDAIHRDLRSALRSGDNVRLNVCGRVATLSGYTNDAMSKRRVERVVLGNEGIDRVINLVTVSR